MKKYIITFLICTSSLMAVENSNWDSTWNLTGKLNTKNDIEGIPLEFWLNPQFWDIKSTLYTGEKWVMQEVY